MQNINKLNLLTECEKAALPWAYFGFLLDNALFGGKREGKVATTKETNISFTYEELEKLYAHIA